MNNKNKGLARISRISANFSEKIWLGGVLGAGHGEKKRSNTSESVFENTRHAGLEACAALVCHVFADFNMKQIIVSPGVSSSEKSPAPGRGGGGWLGGLGEA